MKEPQSAEARFGPATADVIKFFEKAPRLKDGFTKLVEVYAAKSYPSVTDQLLLAYWRNTLEFLSPPLPPSELPIGLRIWEYWENHQEELNELCATGSAICSYLSPTLTRGRIGELSKRHIVELLPREQVFDYLPALDKLFASRGAPVTRRPTALRALQLQIDTGQTWSAITQEVCDCQKKKHDQSCKEAIRQSAIGLKKFLRNLGIDLPKRPSVGA